MFSFSSAPFILFVLLGCVIPVAAWNLQFGHLSPTVKRYLALFFLVVFALLNATFDAQMGGGFWIVFTRAFLIDNLAFIVLAPGFLAIQQPASK